MSQPVVYDASALLALFEASEQAYRLWQRSDDGRTTVVFPATAIADANTTLSAPYDVMHEAKAVRGVVLTSSPQAYRGAAVPVLVP